MSFNWRLLLAPEEILDDVVEHEVAHLRVPHHSDRFWRLLGSRVPEYRSHERMAAAQRPGTAAVVVRLAALTCRCGCATAPRMSPPCLELGKRR